MDNTEKVRVWSDKNKRILGSLFVFILVFFILGITSTKWGFFTDDFGNIFHAQVKSIKEVLRFFYEGSAINFIMPSNVVMAKEESFHNICYRPLTFVYYYIQSLFWGTNAYGYYLVTIFFHALNSALLFYIFSYFTSLFPACLFAMFFAFHPSLANWLGWTAAQQNQISLMFILTIIMIFKKYLDSRKYRYYFFSLLLFLFSLFTREVTLVLPFVIGLGAYLYEREILKIQFSNFFKTILHSFFVISGFLLTAFFYLVIRRTLFPSNVSIFNLVIERILSLKDRGYQFIAFVTDLFGLNWFPWGHRFIKSLIFILIFFVLGWLFLKMKHKIYLIFSLLAAISFMWVAIIQTHDARFLYEALPFFILSFLLLIRFYSGDLKKFKKITYSLACCLIIFNSAFLVFNLNSRGKNYYKIEKAFDELLCDFNTENNPLCFVGIPAQLSPGFAQAIWLRDNSDFRKVYFYISTSSFGDLKGLDKYFRVKVKHYFDANEDFDENVLQVGFVDGDLRFKSSDCERLSFRIPGQDLKDIGLGKIQINNLDSYKRVADFNLVLNEAYSDKDLLFVTWDYKNKKFIVLGH